MSSLVSNPENAAELLTVSNSNVSVSVSGDLQADSINGVPWNFDGVPVSSDDFEKCAGSYVPAFSTPYNDSTNTMHSDPYVNALRERVVNLETAVQDLCVALQTVVTNIGQIYYDGSKRIQQLTGRTK